jgi:hypothetical protein
MALEPSADISRRVWRPCSYCSNEGVLYLLKADANLVYVQCGSCHTCWWLDTGYGVGKRPEEATALPQWPA